MPIDIYAPVIHGIGVRDRQDFVENDVSAIADHLNASDTGWRRDACPAGCDGFEPGHAHLRDAGGRHLVVDPLTWFTEIREPSRWRAAWWFLRALFVLCAVHLLVNGQVLVDAPTLRGLPPYLWRALRAMAWILVIGLLAVVLALPLTLAVAGVPRVRELATDALGWTSDPETRFGVIERVTSRVLDTDARHAVLVGHSQGAAIAANAAHVLDPETTTLVTVGTGQALLAPIRASLDVPWSSILALVGAIIVYVGSVVAIMRTLLLGAAGLLVAIVASLARLVSAAWALATDPASAADHAAAAWQGIADAAAAIVFSPDVVILLACLPLVALTVVVYARTFAPAVQGVRELCRPNVPGVDMCARFDPVCHPFTVLGSPARVAKIAQSASLIDHALYFANEVEVLTEIDRQITGAGSDRTADPVAAGARRSARRLMRRVRVARAAVALAAATAAALLVPGIWAATGAAILAYAAMTAAKHALWKARQRRFAARRRLSPP
ncbi:hypothetical protein [Microbacterium karelineae]|uniref:hypothetical protein n=1 Tax=Microbacterium karelineae TaxID=2654283 RepID=UPI0012E9A98F|nr:hypothetical protein [Microbacterium karelineae]